MALLTLTHNCQLILFCFLLLTVNDRCIDASTSDQIKKKDSAIASEEVKVPEAELPHVAVNDPNPKQPNPIPAAAATTKKANAAEGDKVIANVEPHNKKLTDPALVGGTIQPLERWHSVADESQFNIKETNYDYDDDELPQSYVTFFYVFLGLSFGAMLLILVKVYRLRLSRAERKYGVQGDRSTQVPLVPLPVSVEDCISEDEDQTLFEVNRQQIRIL